MSPRRASEPPAAPAVRARFALAAGALLAALALPAFAQAPAAPDSAGSMPAGLELLRLTPAGQPPLAFLDPDTFGELRDQFNADTAYVRVALLLSPS